MHQKEFAALHPRLGHAASTVQRANRAGQIVPAVGYILDPRPTNDLDDEDDNEYEDDSGSDRRTPNP